MCEFKPPVAIFSAGATTSASSAGPTSGTAIWRGLWAVSAARRAASLRSARPIGVRGGAARSGGRVVGSAMAVAMGQVPFVWVSGGDGQPGPGEPQVDVIEGGATTADRARGQPGLVDRSERLTGGRVVQRHRERLADYERVSGGDAARAERSERDRGVAVDAQLEQLVSES